MIGNHSRPSGRWRLVCILGAVCVLTGCSGVQSALDPAGRAAERIANLFWWMTGMSVIVWVGVVLLTIYAVRRSPDRTGVKQAHRIILAGALTPTIVLAGLLIYGLSMLRDLVAPAPEGSLRVRVYGEQWWWRMRYEPPGRQPFEIANRVVLPVGETVEFLLHSDNVIHSFWIPSLGGKMDLIPGRVNRLALHPVRTGSFRGACAEYCGTAHAQMAFEAIVVTKEEFARWLEQESAPATVQQVSNETP